MSFGERNDNPAMIEAANPKGVKLERKELPSGEVLFVLNVEIPAAQFDELALAWIKYRDLQSQQYNYSLDELLAYGGFNWPIT